MLCRDQNNSTTGWMWLSLVHHWVLPAFAMASTCNGWKIDKHGVALIDVTTIRSRINRAECTRCSVTRGPVQELSRAHNSAIVCEIASYYNRKTQLTAAADLCFALLCMSDNEGHINDLPKCWHWGVARQPEKHACTCVVFRNLPDHLAVVIAHMP